MPIVRCTHCSLASIVAVVTALGGVVACGSTSPEAAVASVTDAVPTDTTVTDSAPADAALAEVHAEDVTSDSGTTEDAGAELGETAPAPDAPDASPEVTTDTGPTDDTPPEVTPDALEDAPSPEDTSPTDIALPSDTTEPPSDISDATAVPDVPDVPVGPPPCEPPLTLTPAAPFANAYGPVYFKATGGTGSYRFALATDASGALLSELLGTYLAGPTVSVVDVVRLTDLGCVGEATATVSVVADLAVLPAAATTPFLGSIVLAATGGSGQLTYTNLAPKPVGTVSASGVYAASNVAGTDTIRVKDTGTGQHVDVTLTVAAGATLLAAPPRLFVPLGSTAKVTALGGSGHYGYATSGTGVTLTKDGLVEAQDPATITVQVTDQYVAGLTTQVVVTGVAAQLVPTARGGDQTAASVLLPLGDVTGDGRADVALGLPEADVLGLNGGAVYVYTGVSGGLAATPTQVIASPVRRDQLGHGLAAGDFDKDGLIDLAVGVPGADPGVTDGGSVWLYRGVVTGAFEETPSKILSGSVASDAFGWAVASCDFDGDGRLDLAISALTDEDNLKSPPATNQGAVHVFLGKPAGFSDKADVVLYGTLPDADGAWLGANELRLGWELAAGDLDGDGKCDLAVNALNYKAKAGQTNDGAVFVYRGIAAKAPSPGGLEAIPVRAWAPTATAGAGTNFGRHLAIGDLDDDGFGDLAVAHYLHEKVATADDNYGAVRVFTGGAFPATPPKVLADGSLAEWSVEGVAKQDQYGWAVAFGDTNADGVSDLVVGNYRHEAAGGPLETGSVTLYPGKPKQVGKFPELPDKTPTRTIGGKTLDERFGEAVAVVPDLDGDGFGDLVAFSARNDELGIDVGRPFFASSKTDVLPLALELPGSAAGAQHGRGAAIVGDITGDGLADLVAGAPLYDPLAQGVNAGGAFVTTGFSATPTVNLIGYLGHSAADQAGHAVAGGGDFDGDGIGDLALVVRAEDVPKTYDAKLYAAGVECVTARNDAGAVLVFRGAGPGKTFSTTPAFVLGGFQTSGLIDAVAFADVNGDGKDDLVAGMPSVDRTGQNDAGGYALWLSTPADATGKTVARCAPDLTFIGLVAGDAVGRSVARAGDIDGDGCDEVAIGANAEDFGVTNQGTVRVVFGFGALCARAAPAELVLGSQVANAQAGFSVAGGLDVDGDTIPDLVTGGFNLSKAGNAVGAVWLIPGSTLKTLSPAAIIDGVMPLLTPMVSPTTTAALRLDGAVVGEQFGRSVALVPDASAPGRAGIAVGSPLGGFSGTALTGGVRVYRFEVGPAMAWSPTPVAAFVGETTRPGGLFGEWVSVGVVGSKRWLVVGGIEGSATSLDDGAVYLVPLD